MVPVASVWTSSNQTLQGWIATTEVNNDDLDWSCQNYVADGMRILYDNGVIDADEYSNGLDQMLEMLEEDNNLDEDSEEEMS